MFSEALSGLALRADYLEMHRWFSQKVQFSFEGAHERQVYLSVEEKERQMESKDRHLA